MDDMESREMAETPTIQKLENLLLVAVPRDLTDSDVLQLRRMILEEVRRYRSGWVLLDFSRVDICDSFFGRFIQSTAKMVGLMGAAVIVSGLQDAVVETMVELGMVLPDTPAVLDLDDALALSRASQRGEVASERGPVWLSQAVSPEYAEFTQDIERDLPGRGTGQSGGVSYTDLPPTDLTGV